MDRSLDRSAAAGNAPRALLTVLLTLVSIPVSARAQAPAGRDVLEARDVFDMEFAADPQISPDGARVVYVRQFSDIMTDQRYSNLWVAGSSGSGERALTTGNFGDASPRWSPDGTRLLFVSDRDGSAQIWVYWMDTGQLTRVTSVQRAPHDPAASGASPATTWR
jgi:dipeptidyl aminopeptidase/acylaminoacyl peptidase